MKKLLQQFLPILVWLPGYERGWLRADLIAGITTWAVAVPTALAYAGIAGVPPLVGLFTVPLPLIAYAIFGTSRSMIVGPDSATALLSFTAIGAVAAQGPEQFVAATSVMALLVGALFALFGILRFGWVANFISVPVMRGFVQGLAWVTIINQVPRLLAIDAVHGNFFAKAWSIVREAHQANLPTAAVGAASIALLIAFKRWNRKIPAGLTTVVIAILAVSLLGLKTHGVEVVGRLASGLPAIRAPTLDWQLCEALLPGALAIALIGYAESLASARVGRQKLGGEFNPNQELIGLGMANVGSAFCGGFVAVGSLSMSSIVTEAGAKTQAASLVEAAIVLLTMLFLLPLFANLPQATLAAIVIQAMLGLIDFSYLKRLRGISQGEFCVAVAATLGVLTLGVLPGIGMGVGLAVLTLTYRSSFPGISVLGKIPGEEVYRDVTRRRDAQTIPRLLIVRFDASPFFANARQIERKVRDLVATADPPPKVVLVDAENMNMIDSTAIDSLAELHAELTARRVELYFAHVKDPVWDAMRRGGLEETVGRDHFFESIADGVKAFSERKR